jgi:hypothetical protein
LLYSTRRLILHVECHWYFDVVGFFRYQIVSISSRKVTNWQESAIYHQLTGSWPVSQMLWIHHYKIISARGRLANDQQAAATTYQGGRSQPPGTSMACVTDDVDAPPLWDVFNRWLIGHPSIYKHDIPSTGMYYLPVHLRNYY